MATLSIILPDPVAKASKEAAKKLGVSRTQFIRQAIVHELENYRAQQEQREMAKSLLAMKNDKTYLNLADEMMDELSTELPKEKNQWWNKKKS